MSALQSLLVQGAIVGVCLARLDGTVEFSQNADLRLMPASNEKVFTTLFALNQLGPDYQPTTRVFSLADRIMVNATGDPQLTSGSLKELAKMPGWNRKRPVHVYQAYKPGIPEGWEKDDLPNKYAAPVYAFTVDLGAFSLIGRDGTVIKPPNEFNVVIQRLGGKGSASVNFDPATRIIKVKGAIPKGETVLDTLALPNPPKSAALFLGSSFHEEPEPFKGTPTDILAGPNLISTVKSCMQPSDNQLAEQLFLMAANKDNDLVPESPYGQAQQRLKSFLTNTVGIAPWEVSPSDGSGLSRHNLMTPNSMVKALTWATTQSWFDQYYDAMAAPGLGTLKNRLSGSSFRGKTGTLDNVVALSGYVTTPTGERKVISILVNHASEGSAKVRELVDQMIRTVENGGSLGTTLAE